MECVSTSDASIPDNHDHDQRHHGRNPSSWRRRRGLAFGPLRRIDPRLLSSSTLGILLTRMTDFVPLGVTAVVTALRGSAAIGWHWCAVGVALLAQSLTAIGAALADRIWHVLERPTRRRVLTFVALAGVAAPAFTGIIDLAVRARTP